MVKVNLKTKQFVSITPIADAKVTLTLESINAIPQDIELTKEISDVQNHLNDKGYCVIEFSNAYLQNEDQIITYFSYFLRLIGMPIRVFQNEKSIWRRIGVKPEKLPNNSEGVGNSPLHIDFVNSTHPPDIVGLLCIRADINGGGVSLVSNLRTSIAELNEDDRYHLSQPVFNDGLFYNLSNIGTEYSPFPIISSDGDDFIRFTEKLCDNVYSPQIDKTLHKLKNKLSANQIEISLDAFQLILLNQKRVVHGKTRLKGRQDDINPYERRELLQIFIRDNMSKNTLYHAERIYNYLNVNFQPKKPDFILVLGSNDLCVAEYAAEYYLKNSTDYIIVSGGLGKITKDIWKVTEAKKFSEIMIQNGVPAHKIYLDEEATNTGDNILNSKRIIELNCLPHNEGVLISKPYMPRRAYNTASKQWSAVKWSSMSEEICFDDYLKRIEDKEQFINVLVGDLQRIRVYGDKGFQIEDDVPHDVWSSFEFLSTSGYDRFVIKD